MQLQQRQGGDTTEAAMKVTMQYAGRKDAENDRSHAPQRAQPARSAKEAEQAGEAGC
jgi:hypothetical protein